MGNVETVTTSKIAVFESWDRERGKDLAKHLGLQLNVSVKHYTVLLPPSDLDWILCHASDLPRDFTDPESKVIRYSRSALPANASKPSITFPLTKETFLVLTKDLLTELDNWIKSDRSGPIPVLLSDDCSYLAGMVVLVALRLQQRSTKWNNWETWHPLFSKDTVNAFKIRVMCEAARITISVEKLDQFFLHLSQKKLRRKDYVDLFDTFTHSLISEQKTVKK